MRLRRIGGAEGADDELSVIAGRPGTNPNPNSSPKPDLNSNPNPTTPTLTLTLIIPPLPLALALILPGHLTSGTKKADEELRLTDLTGIRLGLGGRVRFRA